MRIKEINRGSNYSGPPVLYITLLEIPSNDKVGENYYSKLLMYLFEDRSTYSQKYEGGWLQLLVA